jgi:hypothetical protein
VARREITAGPSKNESNTYSLNATPLKEAKPMELEVASGLRSP